MARFDSPRPVVGREPEIRLAHESLRAGRSVVIAGAVGVGKTTLARAVLSAAADDGAATSWAVASRSARPIPLGALAHLVPRDVVDERVEPDRLLAAMVSVLSAPQSRRLVVGVDDAHLLDGPSAALVRLLATTDQVRVVLTVRTGEFVPDAIAGLAAEGTADRIELQELTEPEAAQFLAQSLGGPVDRASVRRLWTSTRGNPLFLDELVRALRTHGALTAESGWWRWVGPFPSGTTARSLIAARTAHLDADQRAGLEVVAHGEPVELALVEELVDPAVVSSLEEDGLVAVDLREDTPWLRTAHPLYGEAVRAATPLSRTRQLSRTLASAMAGHPDLSPTDRVRAAVWSVDGGTDVPSDLLVDAARQCWVAGDAALAERLARGAVGSARDHEARYLLGEALADRGRFEDAIAEFSALAEVADGDMRAAACRGQAEILGHVLGRRADAIAVLDAALAATDESFAEPLLATRAILLAHEGAVDEAVSSATALLERDLSPQAELQALLTTLPVDLFAGRIGVVERQLDRARAAAEAAAPHSPNAQLWVGLLGFSADLFQGRLDAAESRARQQLDAALETTHPVGRGYWTEAVGVVFLRRGQPVQAASLFEEAIAIYGLYANGSRWGGLQALALAHALAGDVAAAKRALAEAEAEDRGAPVSLVDPGSARAWTLAAEGRLSAAADVAADAAARARARGSAVHELHLLHDAARLGGARQAIHRVRELAPEIDGAWASAVVAHVTGLATDDEDALVQAATGFDSQGALLDAAEAWAAAAKLARASGHPAALQQAGRRAAGARERCADARTPGLAFAAWDDPLTGREREVALLVARGLADKEVARQLGISVRTVNAHLRSVYVKLGIEGRGDIVVALGDST